MRIIKTCLALCLCLFIDWLSKSPEPLNAGITAIVCLQHNYRSTLESSVARVIGTLFAGLYAYLFLLLFRIHIGLDPSSLVFYLLVGLFVIPLMQILVRLIPGGVVIAAIVYLIICLTASQQTPLDYAFQRVLDTLVGLIAVVLVDWFPPLNRLGDRLQQARERALDHSDPGSRNKIHRLQDHCLRSGIEGPLQPDALSEKVRESPCGPLLKWYREKKKQARPHA